MSEERLSEEEWELLDRGLRVLASDGPPYDRDDSYGIEPLRAKLHHLRAALPTPEEREALRFAMENVQGVFNLDWPTFTREERARAELALAALARLVEERGA